MVIFAIYLIPFYLLNADIKARNWYFGNSHLRNFSMGIHPIVVVGIIQLTGYLVLSLHLLANHAKYIRQNFSSLENIRLSWLRTIFFVFILLIGMYIFFAVFAQFYGIYEEAAYFNHLLVAVVIYVMGYKGIRQPEIFTITDVARAVEDRIKTNADDKKPETVVRDMSSLQEAGLTGKYRKSALTAEQAGKIRAGLTKVREQEKPYLDMELTLPVLSKMLDVSPHHLSQMINENLKKSFFDYVNEYRVEEARKALLSSGDDGISIPRIAMDAGFNSKSTFYSALKNTPA